jgi:adenosylcobinamide kinase/adenosylcobinamide-phosphate guanylyltransferase
VADLVEAWQAIPRVAVAVTNEVGWGLVSEHRSGRVFTDLLGQVNAAFAAASEDVVLMVAGRPLYV